MAVDTARFQGDLGRAAAIAESRMRNIRESARRTVAQLAVIGTAVGTALTAAVSAAINRADQFNDLAQAVGLTTEQLTKLDFAAKQSGLSSEDLNTGLVRLAKHMQEIGDKRTMVERINELADQFQAMPDGVAKTNAALDNFGKAGARWIPLLNAGRDGLKQMGDEAQRLGLVISTQTARAADEFNDRLGELRGVATGISTQLAAQMLPVLNALGREFLTTATRAAAVDDAVRAAATGFRVFLTGTEVIRFTLAELGKTFGGLAAAFMATVRGEFAAAWEILGNISADGRENMEKEVTRLLDIWDDLGVQTSAGSKKAAEELAKPVGDAVKQIDAWIAKLMQDEAAMVAFYERLREEASKRDELIKSNIGGDLEEAGERARLGFEKALEAANEMSVFAEQAARNMQDAFANFLFEPFADGLEGMVKGFADAVRRMIAEMAAAKFFEFVGGALAGSSNKVLAGIGNFLTPRAMGGPVTAGRPYLVGERGPELFIPSNSGQIAASAGGGSVVVSYNIDARGADAERIMAILPPLLKQTEDRTIARVRDLQNRGRM